MQGLRMGRFTVLAAMLAAPSLLQGQSAIDPSVAPRAAAMARQGQRAEATDLLGRYLSTAPYDAAAWLELGRLYLDANREWHLTRHSGDPGGDVLLDFASAAFEQSLDLPSDSGPLLRLRVEAERAAAALEKLGWTRLQAEFMLPEQVEPPAYVMELGRNLLTSCPVGGVLVTGSDLETTAVWGAALTDRVRGDLVLVDLFRWADSRYREAISDALGTPDDLPLASALLKVSASRPVCLSPGVAIELAPDLPMHAARVVRVAGPPAAESGDPVRVTALVAAVLARPGPVSGEVLELYRAAARFNPNLCAGLLLPLESRSREACGQ